MTGVLSLFLGIIVRFFVHAHITEFDKMQIPIYEYVVTPILYISLFGDNRSLCFCALASVGALFLFILHWRLFL